MARYMAHPHQEGPGEGNTWVQTFGALVDVATGQEAVGGDITMIFPSRADALGFESRILYFEGFEPGGRYSIVEGARKEP